MRNAANWDRVKQIFQDALERQPEERAQYVRQQCGADRELQAEVESLLATHQDAGSFAERPAVELLDGLPADPTGASRTSQSPGVRPGDRLGVYEIQSLIGVGGMGEVYKARDTRLDRTVAIKVLPTHFAADRERYERFEREARAVASLDHPHIGALYDVGEHDGVSFLVMQYLDGETLAARLARGAVPLDQALRYAIDLADALDHAHRRGIVHRDVKPGNIVLTKAGATLLDFGLAKWRAGRRMRAQLRRPSEPSHPTVSPRRACLSAHCTTWPRNNSKADPLTRARTVRVRRRGLRNREREKGV